MKGRQHIRLLGNEQTTNTGRGLNGLGLWITFTNERPQTQKSQSWLHCGTGVSRKSCPPYSMTFRLMSPYLETKERLSLFYLDKCNK